MSDTKVLGISMNESTARGVVGCVVATSAVVSAGLIKTLWGVAGVDWSVHAVLAAMALGQAYSAWFIIRRALRRQYKELHGR